MRIALAIWNDRISPVFDVSRQLMVVDVENGNVTSRRYEALGGEDFVSKVDRLAYLGVDTLICGAVSRPLADMISASGIEIFPFSAGNVDEIIEAYLRGFLHDVNLAMPGCGGRRGRFRRGRQEGQVLDAGQWKQQFNYERRQAMPRGDGTGPRGKGPGTGKGRGGCKANRRQRPGDVTTQDQGQDQGRGQGRGQGQGRGRGQRGNN